MCYSFHEDEERKQWVTELKDQQETTIWQNLCVYVCVVTDRDSLCLEDSIAIVQPSRHTKPVPQRLNYYHLSDLTFCNVGVGVNASQVKWAGTTVNCVSSSFQQIKMLCRWCCILRLFHLLSDQVSFWVLSIKEAIKDKKVLELRKPVEPWRMRQKENIK